MSKLTWAGTLAARLGGWTERGQGRLRAIRQGTGPEHGLEVEGPGSRAMSPWHRLLTSSLPRLEEGQDGSSRAQAQDAWLPRSQGSAASHPFKGWVGSGGTGKNLQDSARIQGASPMPSPCAPTGLGPRALPPSHCSPLHPCSLTGISPFVGENDRTTLMNIRNYNVAFEETTFLSLSREARGFLIKVLVRDRL